MDATIRLEHELLAVESEHQVHAMLELTAPSIEGADRPPLHLALVLDRSGSMQGSKLEAAKSCAFFLADHLKPDDELALVSFDDEVQLVAPLQPAGIGAARAAIPSLYPGGTTNLSGGWLKGVEELGRAGEDGIRKVLLLTDGQANVGIIEAPALASMASNAAQQSTVGTTTIGFGDGFDEDLLTAMADAGGGNAHYAATADDAAGIFAREFDDLLALAAQNLSVEIRPCDDVEFVGVLNEYPIIAVPGGVQVQVGDAYADETRRVVFELHVPNIPALGLTKIADVVLRYVTVGDQIAAHEITLPMTVNAVSSDDAAGVLPDEQVIEEVVILKSARAQREARDLADRGDIDGAKKMLRSTAKDLRNRAPDSERAEQLIADADELDEQVNMMDTYSPGVRKSMTYSANEKRRRRPRNEP